MQIQRQSKSILVRGVNESTEIDCADWSCCRADSGPGSGPRAQADEQLKIAMADYIAEAAVVSQNLQAM